MLSFKLLLITVFISLFCIVNTSLAKVRCSKIEINANESLQKLQEGNARFIKTSYRHPHQSKYRRFEVLKGQHPFAVIITCSDSRVPPDIIFDQGLGDLFVIRNAGNVSDEHVIASVEYAVCHLGIPLVVVMGHQNCGAVTAALQDAKDSKHITNLVKSIKPAVEIARRKKGDLLDNSIRYNVQIVVNELKRSKPIIAKLAKEGSIKVLGAYYHLDTGKVDFIY